MLEILFPVGLAAFFLAIILPLIGSKLGNSKIPRQASFISTAIASIAIMAFSLEIILSAKSYSVLAYQITPLFQFSFTVDRLAAFFLLLIGIVSVSVAIYSMQYVEHGAHKGRKNLIASLMSVFIVSMVLVVASASTFSFLFFWEIMALSSFLLVMSEFEKPETQKAGMFYFVMTHLSTLFLLFAFIFMYTVTGTFNIQSIQADPFVTSVAFVLLFLAFGIKAGIIPLHKWLPLAHPASPSNISALMSGVMIKVAIYGLVRFVLLLPLQTWWGFCFWRQAQFQRLSASFTL